MERAPSNADAHARVPQQPVELPSVVVHSRPTAPKKGRFGWPWLVAVAAAALIGWWAMASLGRHPEVTVAVASVVDLGASFTAEAYVRGTDYPLSTEAAGKVVGLYVRENDEVAAGQLLLEVDDAELRAQVRQAEAALRAAALAESQAKVQLTVSRDQANARVAAARADLNQAEAKLKLTLKGARSQEVAEATHRLQALQAAVDAAEKALQRAQFLFEQGAVPRANLDDAEARYKSAKAARDEASAALDLLRAGPRPEEADAARAAVQAARAEVESAVSGLGQMAALRQAVAVAHSQWAQALAVLDQANANLPKTVLRAPVAGVVSKLDTEVGTIASPTAPAMTLSTRRDLRIEAEVSSEDAAKVSKGMKVTVSSPTYPGQTFPATVTEVSPVGELKPDAAIRTRIIRTRVMLDRDWSLFKPGMEVDVEGTATIGKALSVPSDAISLDGSRSFVYVVSNGRVRERDVKTGYANVDYTEILSGIQAGDVVVVRGKEELTNGVEVEVRR